MSDRPPRRAATKGINYREPGDDPELSDSEESLVVASGETHHSGYESALDCSFAANDSELEESVLLDSTVVASVPSGVLVGDSSWERTSGLVVSQYIVSPGEPES